MAVFSKLRHGSLSRTNLMYSTLRHTLARSPLYVPVTLNTTFL